MSNPSASPIQQTSNAKYVSLIPENGNEFLPRQKIVFNIDPSIGFVKARDSYFVFDLLNNGTLPIKTILGHAGASSIINQVNIYSKQNGMLLETLTDYNKWVACEAPYRHDVANSLSTIEGFPPNIEPYGCQKPVAGGAVPQTPNPHNTYMDVANHRFSQQDNAGNATFAKVRFCVPLRTGIFRYWDDETLVPILQMGGLRIELILEEGFKALSMAYVGNKMNDGLTEKQGGLFKSEDGKGNLLCENFASGQKVLVLSATELTDVNLAGFLVGNKVRVRSGAIDTANGNTTGDLHEIDTITIAGNKVNLTMKANLATATADGSAFVYLDDATMLLDGNLSYKVMGAELRLLQEIPPNQKMSNIDYVFTSYDVFRSTIPQTQLSFNQDVTSVASKALALFTMFEDTNRDGVAQFPRNHDLTGLNNESGFNLNSLVYFINNKLYPLTAYNPSGKGDRVIHINELVKAFGAINIPVKSLGSAKGADLDAYTNRYLLARELARGQSVFNLQNAEPQIRLGFSSARGSDEHTRQIGNVRMLTFVFSKKILRINGETGLSIEH